MFIFIKQDNLKIIKFPYWGFLIVHTNINLTCFIIHVILVTPTQQYALNDCLNERNICFVSGNGETSRFEGNKSDVF